MEIRKGVAGDLDDIMAVYTAAKEQMTRSGNLSQWLKGYPQRELIAADIAAGQCYVAVADGAIHGVFALIFGDDPTYAVIDGDGWLNAVPYATIHRIGADGAGGVFAAAIDYAKGRSDELRIDTHADNGAMRHLIVKHGFKPCGTIYLEDGSPRLAFHYSAAATAKK